MKVLSKKKYELFFGCLGNGVTVCNKAVEEHGDYKKIAHIGASREITWYDKSMPDDVRKTIEDFASREVK